MSCFRFYDANPPQNLSDRELQDLKKLSKSNNLVVPKADKGNSVVLVGRDVFVNHMENILKDNTKFWKVDIKTRTLNFQVNHEKRINETLKVLKVLMSFKSAGSLSDKQYKKIKAVGSRAGVFYWDNHL